MLFLEVIFILFYFIIIIFLGASSWSSLAFQPHNPCGFPPVSRGVDVPRPPRASHNPRFFWSFKYLGCLDWAGPSLLDS